MRDDWPVRLLFTSTPLDGHVRPLLPLAHALRSRGHEVAFVTHESWHGHIETEGFRGLRRRGRARRGAAPARSIPRRDPGAAAARAAAAGLSPALRPRSRAGEARRAAARCNEWQPDALVWESSDLAGAIAAAALGIPAVNHSFGAMVPLAALRLSEDAALPLWRRVGVEPQPYVARSPVSTSTRARRRSRGSGHSARRCCLAPASTGGRARRPGSMISSGRSSTSRSGRSSTIRPRSGTCSTGSATSPVRSSRPDATSTRPRSAPFPLTSESSNSFLRKTSSLPAPPSSRMAAPGSTLARSRTACRSCSCRRAADQFENAARVDTAGAGVVVMPEALSGESVRAALQRVLGEASLADAARRVAAEISAMPTPDEVAIVRRGVRGPRLVWPRVGPHAHSPRRRRPGGARRGRRHCRRRALRGGGVRRRPTAGPAPQPRQGFPPLELSLGIRDDAEARRAPPRGRALRSRATGSRRRAIFARYDSLEAKLGSAFAAWPASEDRIEQLGALYPRSSLVQLHVGLARFWAGTGGRADRVAGGPRRRARHALRGPRGRLPAPGDSRRGCPASSSSFDYEIEGETPADAAASCSRPTGRRAAGCSTGSRCRDSAGPSRRGARSRRRCELAPNDVDALVADAVGRYDKGNPCGGVLPSRPAQPPFPGCGDRPLPPRPAAALAEGPEGGDAPARARAGGASPAARSRARRSDSSMRFATQGPPDRKDGPNGLWRCGRCVLASSRSFVRRVLRIARVATTLRARSEGEPK